MRKRRLLNEKALIRILTNAQPSEVLKALDTLGLLEEKKQAARDEFYAVNDFLLGLIPWDLAEPLNELFKDVLEYLNGPVATFSEADLQALFEQQIGDIQEKYEEAKEVPEVVEKQGLSETDLSRINTLLDTIQDDHIVYLDDESLNNYFIRFEQALTDLKEIQRTLFKYKE